MLRQIDLMFLKILNCHLTDIDYPMRKIYNYLVDNCMKEGQKISKGHSNSYVEGKPTMSWQRKKEKTKRQTLV